MKKMWSGRFDGPLAGDFERWQRSLPFDRRLLAEELAASRAHARALEKIGLLSTEELTAVLEGLENIAKKADAPRFLDDAAAEDVHHCVENWLVELIGETGYKLHVGRSRNEQIAADLRLYVRDQIHRIEGHLRDWIETLLSRGSEAGEAAMPAYTHGQPAEPVLVAHWLLAFVEMFLRDLERLLDCLKRVNVSPLGSGAVAGSTVPLDRTLLAESLGFERASANSIDATSDRDFCLEFAQALALVGIHLSGWAEEMLRLSAPERGFLRLPEAYTTGSSAMPQKQNPDALELIRAKSGRIIGAEIALQVTLKGLPLAYNKDLQETQEPLFDAAETALGMLEIAREVMSHTEFDYERMSAAAQSGFLNAMAAATYLAHRGTPFRRAHEQVGRAVRLCLEKKCELQDLSLEELRRFGDFDAGVYRHLTLASVLALHDVPGGTAPAQVRAGLVQASERLAMLVGERHAHA